MGLELTMIKQARIIIHNAQKPNEDIRVKFINFRNNPDPAIGKQAVLLISEPNKLEIFKEIGLHCETLTVGDTKIKFHGQRLRSDGLVEGVFEFIAPKEISIDRENIFHRNQAKPR